MKRSFYRDRQTGRFVKRSTWQRSKAQGGTRFVRERVSLPRPKPKPEPEEEFERGPIRDLDELETFIEESDEDLQEYEFEGAFDSP